MKAIRFQRWQRRSRGRCRRPLGYERRCDSAVYFAPESQSDLAS
jgi:hypothetical protein